MEVEIIRNKEGKAVGWSIDSKDISEKNTLAIIRDLQFFGMDDTKVVYNGRYKSDDKNGYPGRLEWIQSKEKKD
jgi:hypothetical protein